MRPTIILQETAAPDSVVLWHLFTDVEDWIAYPALRGRLFGMAGLNLRGVQPLVAEAVSEIHRLLSGARAAADPARALGTECLRIAVWAQQQGAQGTALAYERLGRNVLSR